MKIYNFFLDLIAPKKCLCCKKEGYFLCFSCYSKIEKFSETCYVCKKYSKDYYVHENCKDQVYYDRAIILNHYKNYFINKFIKDGKFYNKKEVFFDFSIFFLKLLSKEKLDGFYIVSIPSHFTRKILRGYNSSEVLSIYFSELVGLDYKKLLYKNRYTKQQSKLKRNNRIFNLKDSFSIYKKYENFIKGKNFIIMDDVISTGSTINEVSKILKEKGANSVYSLVISSD